MNLRKNMTNSMLFESPGKCIYCERPFSPEQLTDEHIIPEAIGGAWVFKKASCNNCKDKISPLEGSMANNEFEPFKVHACIVGKALTKRVKLKNLLCSEAMGSNWQHAWIHKDADAGVMTLLTFLAPALPIHPPTGDTQLGVTGIDFIPLTTDGLSRLSRTLTDLPGGTGKVSRHRIEDMGRLICKIAHGFAVAKLGLNFFRPVLPPIILGDSLNCLGDYFGSIKRKDHACNDLHEAELDYELIRGERWAYVDVCLFAICPWGRGYSCRAYVGPLLSH